MKLKLSIVISIFCLSANAQSVFQKYFSEFLEYQQFSLSSFDSTYVIAGSRWFDGTFYDFCAAKLDKNGAVIWSKSFTSPNDDYLSSLSVSPEGEILLSGYKSNSAGDYDFSLMKLDASGNLQWYKTFGTSSSEVSFFTGETSAGDFYISGNRDVSQLPWVLKTNNSGTILWSKTMGTLSGTEAAVVTTVTQDGGVVVLGSLSNGKDFLMKINPDGSTAWTNSYTAPHPQSFSSMKATSDGGSVLTSSDYRCDSVGCRFYFSFMKLGPTGNVSWAKAVEGCLGEGKNGIETTDGGFAFTGELRDSGYYKAVLIKTDKYGNLSWVKSYGHAASFGEGFFVDQTPDGGFALFGIEESKAYLIKTDENGNSGCLENVLTPVLSNINFLKSTTVVIPDTTVLDTATIPVCTEASLVLTDSIICSTVGINESSNSVSCIIYPNPFNQSVTLEIKDNELSVGRLKFNMYDIFGRLVKQFPITDHRLFISRDDLQNGMYFYEVRNDGNVIGKGKIIAE